MDDLGLLRLQMEWGADEALEDEAVVRLRPVIQIADRTRPPGADFGIVLPALTSPATTSGTAAKVALSVAGQASSLDALRAAVAGFCGCALRDTATNLVFAAGDQSPPCLVIGDPPNADDDRSGQPFSGPDGELLDTMLGSVGLDRSRLLLTPLLPWRPPGGRPANPSEVVACLPFLHRLIVLTRPAFLVIAGAQALRALVGTRPRAQGGTRTTVCRIPGMAEPLDAILLPFPASALRTAVARKEAWAALRRIRRMLDAELVPRAP